jgi:hypothetical protein
MSALSRHPISIQLRSLGYAKNAEYIDLRFSISFFQMKDEIHPRLSEVSVVSSNVTQSSLLSGLRLSEVSPTYKPLGFRSCQGEAIKHTVFETQERFELSSLLWFSPLYLCKGTTSVLLLLMKIRLLLFTKISLAS